MRRPRNDNCMGTQQQTCNDRLFCIEANAICLVPALGLQVSSYAFRTWWLKPGMGSLTEKGSISRCFIYVPKIHSFENS